MAGTKRDAEKFVKRWTGKGNENQDTQLFWIDFFQNVLGVEDATVMLKFETPVSTSASDHLGFIDVLVPSASVIIEQKSIGIDLSKPEKRQGRMVTPAQQALGYAQGMAVSQSPRYVIACNFSEMWVYDRERDALCKGNPLLMLPLADLPKNLPAIQFIKGKGEAPSTISQAVSVKAGKIMGRLHDSVAASFIDPDAPESHHALSVLMTRLMFLMFCEDSGLVEPNAFRNYVQHFPAGDLRRALKDLFAWLDTPDAERDPYAIDELKRLPYMNGGLFRERTEIPPLSEDFRTTLIVEGCQEFDWSGVSPTVFGSIFEGALSHDHRRANGQHFTSPENIHRVIDPLFMDDLNAEFEEAKSKPVAGGARKKALDDLHERIGKVSILDPAAGSGNFLTESYLSLRALEDKILLEGLIDGQVAMSFEESDESSQILVSLENFHGIELEDFACCVARTALWIAEKQADARTAAITRRVYKELPLRDYKGIVQGNALRMDWNDVVPAQSVTHVCGNPPFIGYSNLTAGQKEDRASIFGKSGGTLDYVACWYKKAALYAKGHPIRCAFVSTNSVCQGQQVEPLWKPLFQDGIHIDFAWPTFVWNAETSDQAHVHVVIIGFSYEERSMPRLFFADNTVVCKNINGYLMNGSNQFILKRDSPLSNAPVMRRGGGAGDWGNLTLSEKDAAQLIAEDPSLARWIRPFSMGAEFIKGQKRFCLWFVDATPAQLRELPADIKERIDSVHRKRIASPRKSTRAHADIPWLFDELSYPASDRYVAVPQVSSGRRDYVPIGFIDDGTIPGNKLFYISDASLFEFGILGSRFHNAWMRMVAGRLKSDYQYSSKLVYNTFVWPNPTESQHTRIESCAQAVLDARALYPDSSLADLYDPDFMPVELRKAHRALDAAVEAAYGVDFGDDEERIVSHLFKLYAERTGE